MSRESKRGRPIATYLVFRRGGYRMSRWNALKTVLELDLHWSRFVIVPVSWLLDRIGKHNACDDLDNCAADRGWWHR